MKTLIKIIILVLIHGFELSASDLPIRNNLSALDLNDLKKVFQVVSPKSEKQQPMIRQITKDRTPPTGQDYVDFLNKAITQVIKSPVPVEILASLMTSDEALITKELNSLKGFKNAIISGAHLNNDGQMMVINGQKVAFVNDKNDQWSKCILKDGIYTISQDDKILYDNSENPGVLSEAYLIKYGISKYSPVARLISEFNMNKIDRMPIFHIVPWVDQDILFPVNVLAGLIESLIESRGNEETRLKRGEISMEHILNKLAHNFCTLSPQILEHFINQKGLTKQNITKQNITKQDINNITTFVNSFRPLSFVFNNFYEINSFLASLCHTIITPRILTPEISEKLCKDVHFLRHFLGFSISQLDIDDENKIIWESQDLYAIAYTAFHIENRKHYSNSSKDADLLNLIDPRYNLHSVFITNSDNAQTAAEIAVNIFTQLTNNQITVLDCHIEGEGALVITVNCPIGTLEGVTDMLVIQKQAKGKLKKTSIEDVRMVIVPDYTGQYKLISMYPCLYEGKRDTLNNNPPDKDQLIQEREILAYYFGFPSDLRYQFQYLVKPNTLAIRLLCDYLQQYSRIDDLLINKIQFQQLTGVLN